MKHIKYALYYLIKATLSPLSKARFLFSIENKSEIHLLDVGCGNNSPIRVKSILNKIYYVGIDVGNYNQSKESQQKYADEYIIVNSSYFANKISTFNNLFDVVISSHNIEHCEEPQKVLLAMIKALKKDGRLFMSFPSEESLNFPSRNGTLNFYDDPTHRTLPNWNDIIDTLQSNGMQLTFAKKSYQPFFFKTIGKLNEHRSSKTKMILPGIWEYYGFESIIWAKKKSI